jgi:16S rRNA (guanine527-N7)-methyltransferase
VTEDEAKDWIWGRFGSDVFAQLEILAKLVIEESGRQNLISASTLPQLWSRHIVDSAQLIRWDQAGRWLDIGTGAGFPGLVIAILRARVIMAEPRRRRAEFLQSCLDALQLGDGNVVHALKAEALPREPFAVISARAVASLPDLIASASHCATPETIWLLPKGRNAADEVAEARRTWHGMFHVEHSITDPESLVVIAKGVRRR